MSETITQPKITVNQADKSYTVSDDPGYINKLDTTTNRYIRSAIPTAPVTTTTPTTPTTTDTTTPSRFVRTPGAYDAGIDQTKTDLLTAYDAQAPAKTLDEIRAEKQQTAEKQADLIRSQFAGLLTEDRAAGDVRNARTRAANISAGLAGSDFGAAAADNTETANKKIIQQREMERDSKINAILSQVDDQASQEYDKQRQNTIKSLEGKLDLQNKFVEGERNKALETIKGLASNGVSLQKLKETEPDAFKTIAQQYGGSEVDMDTAWNDSLPDKYKVKYEDTIIEGPDGNAQILRYGVNPLTNTIDKKTFNLDTNYNMLKGVKPISAGGRLYKQNSDGTLTPLTDATTKSTASTKPYVSGTLTLTADQLSQGEQALKASQGQDGYVDPSVYQAAYEEWIDNGGLKKDFLAKYAPNDYVNPDNTWLPQYLRSTKKGGKTAPSNGTSTPSGRSA